MGDLISRSAVIDILKETGIIQDNDLGHLVIDEINRIPTAYDVDAVVVQLEKITESYNLGSYNMGIDKAIDIVRKGGKE